VTRPENIPPFRYEERAPSAAIAPWVLSLWTFQADIAPAAGDPYTVWADGCTSVGVMRIPRVPAFPVIVGPRFTAMQPGVVAGMRMWGVRAWPDASATLTGMHARELRNQLGAAPPAVAQRFSALLTALPADAPNDATFGALDAWLRALLAAAPPPDRALRAAVRTIVASNGEASLADIAAGAAMSTRQLQRRFPTATGLTVSEYSRVRRLRAALAHRLEDPANWSRIAAEVGFVDHAHLTREFVALTGMPPTHAARQLARTAHANVTP